MNTTDKIMVHQAVENFLNSFDDKWKLDTMTPSESTDERCFVIVLKLSDYAQNGKTEGKR